MKVNLKLIKRIFIALSAIICILLISSSFSFFEKRYSFKYNNIQINQWSIYIDGVDVKDKITLPHRVQGIEKNTDITIVSQIPKVKINDPYLLIRVSQQTISVKIDNELIYQFNSMMDKREKSSGAVWRLIKIPSDCYGKEISLTFNSSYEETSGIINQVYLGDKSDHLLVLIKKSIVSLMVGFTLVIFSVFVMVLYYSIKYKHHVDMKEYFYLSLFLITLSIIVLVESQGMTFILNNFALHYYAEFIALFIIPICFYQYVYYSYGLEKKDIIKKLMYVHCIVFALGIIGEFTGIYEFFRSQFKFFIIFIITLTTCLVVTFKEVSKNKNLIRFVLASIMVIVILLIDVILFFIRKENIGGSVLLIAIIIVEIALRISIFDKVFSYFKSNTENVYLQKQINTNLYYYSNMKNKSNKLRKFRHDMKNHFVAINYLLEGNRIEEAKEYIGKLNNHIVESSEIIDTGNYILDAIITEKKIRASKLKINFITEINIKPDIKLDAVDWCIIFSNILDNALEACNKVENGEKKIIVDLKTKGNMFIIKIWNSFDGKLIKSKSGYETRKLNKEYHGFGLKNIKESIKKYEGTYKIDTTENIFKVSIILMNVI